MSSKATSPSKSHKREKTFQEHMGAMERTWAREHESVRDNLVLTALDQMCTEVEDKITIPRALEQNKYIWARAMFKHKAL